MWKTGHSHIKSRMKESGAPLAGEMTGHIFFAENWYGFDDGVLAALRLMAATAGLGRSIADLPRPCRRKPRHPNCAWPWRRAHARSISWRRCVGRWRRLRRLGGWR
jgi:phosphomannomutase